MNNVMETTSYVTYQYNVYPRIVEKHASSNIVKTLINGANLKITIKSIQSSQLEKNIIIFTINVNNCGNKVAHEIRVIDVLNNKCFIKGSLVINGLKVPNYELKDGFFLKYLKPKDCINIIFAAKSNICGDLISLVSGFYYFINDKNEKIYRKASSNLNKITINYSYFKFDVKYENTPFLLNENKIFSVSLKNTGNKDALKVKFNILLPNELKLKSNSIVKVNDESVNLDDKYGFFVGDLNQNESKQINFKIEFVEFKNRYIVPIAMFCSFYNVNEDNLQKKYDSELYRIVVNLTPNKTRNS